MTFETKAIVNSPTLSKVTPLYELNAVSLSPMIAFVLELAGIGFAEVISLN